jgi:hypothetical protein
VPTLKQKKNGDYIIQKNTSNVASAPPVSTFQVDPLAVSILAATSITHDDYLDGDLFWSLYEMNLLETSGDNYEPAVPEDVNLDGFSGFNGLTEMEKARFVSELLDSHCINRLAESEAVLNMIESIDQIIIDDIASPNVIETIKDELREPVQKTLCPTPFDTEFVFSIAEMLSDEVGSSSRNASGPLIWSIFFSQFYQGFDDIEVVLTDIRESSKNAIQFEFDDFVVALTCETWYFVGPKGLDNVSSGVSKRLPSYDMHELFLTQIPVISREFLRQRFTSRGKYAISLGEVLGSGYEENHGYLVILPSSKALSFPKIAM